MKEKTGCLKLKFHLDGMAQTLIIYHLIMKRILAYTSVNADFDTEHITFWLQLPNNTCFYVIDFNMETKTEGN